MRVIMVFDFGKVVKYLYKKHKHDQISNEALKILVDRIKLNEDILIKNNILPVLYINLVYKKYYSCLKESLSEIHVSDDIITNVNYLNIFGFYKKKDFIDGSILLDDPMKMFSELKNNTCPVVFDDLKLEENDL